ncbi:MAG: hypothetical protein WD200_04590 [Candidatus Andersenbacteria bacterium]
MNKKYFFYFVALLAILTLAVAVLGWYFYPSQPQKLDREEYKTVKDSLVAIVISEDPRVALEKLSQLTEKRSAVSGSCHALVHEIGHASYDRYQDVGEALYYRDEICGSGYLHGVIEGHMRTVPDVNAALRTVCSPYTDRFLRGSCYHGVGHGLMYYSNDNLPESLDRCQTYSHASDRVSCAEGVFMENFNTDQKLHPSAYLNEEDPFSLCRTQALDSHKGVCYFYAPLYYLNAHPGKYKQVFDWCQTAEESFTDACIKGASSRITKENMQNIALAERLCGGLVDEYQGSCAAGIGSYHLTHYGDRERTRQMCLTLRQEFQPVCLKAIQ